MCTDITSRTSSYVSAGATRGPNARFRAALSTLHVEDLVLILAQRPEMPRVRVLVSLAGLGWSRATLLAVSHAVETMSICIGRTTSPEYGYNINVADAAGNKAPALSSKYWFKAWDKLVSIYRDMEERDDPTALHGE